MLINAQINDKQKHLLEKLKELEALGYGQMSIYVIAGKINRVEVTVSKLSDPEIDDPFKDLQVTMLG
jgi:hypothetical protein